LDVDTAHASVPRADQAPTADATSPVPFGAGARAAAWARFARETFDCFVVGGGITGAAVARDAALRGLRTALVEKGDYASGTSSGSSQLVHGGLRYLERLEVHLVFEALRERGVLLRIAAPFVRPLPFLLPAYRGGRFRPWALALGLTVYDGLAVGRRIEPHRRLDPSRLREVEPGLRPQDLLALFRYADALTDDARLTLATVQSAAAAGAACANYVEAVGLRFEDGRIAGVELRDALTGARAMARARAVVNAAGPWAERVLRLTGRPVRPLVRPTRGSHLVVSHGRLPVRHAILFESPARDGRVLFVIPWEGFTLVGTTEVEHAGDPDRVVAEPDEVRYLLDAANWLFPRAGLRAADLRGTYAALRPLAWPERGPRLGALSREHAIFEDPPGLVTVVGGKLTTHRAMAEDVVDRALERLRDPGGLRPPRSRTAYTPLASAVPPPLLPRLLREVEARARALRLPAGLPDRLLQRYGAYAPAVLALAAERPDGAEPLAPRVPHLRAEIVHAARFEMACTVSDVMLRRTRLVHGAGARDTAVARAVADVLAAELGWSAARRAEELDRYADDRERRRAGLPDGTTRAAR
jgi:glycerol-3-phosphate dehydrogenase